MTEFTCNICGAACREAACSSCGATLRDRAILHVLSMELFGVELTLPEFPRLKSLRGLGASDSHVYAERLAAKFDYRNTFFDRPPRLDLTAPPEEEFGRYDFLISSEVMEHVVPPVEAAFRNACRLLKPHGILVLTTPYSLEAATVEHYPDLHRFGFAEVDGKLVVVNRTPAGELQVFDNPVFHLGSSGQTLEVREFSECGLKGLLADAGFASVRIYGENCAEFGIVRSESWSLPMAARKGMFTLGADATREVMEHWRELNRSLRRLRGKLWFRAGYKLRLL